MPRHLERFAAHDDSIAFDFPLLDYEWEQQQRYRVTMIPIVGADYAHDVRGFSPAPVENGKHMVRGNFVPESWDEYDTIKAEAFSKCRRIGAGKLYTIDDSSARRWAWARLMGLPDVTMSSEIGRILPLIFDFETQSDWHDVAATQGSINLNSAAQLFDITNPGDLPTEHIVFRLRSNSATGFANPILRNLTAGSLYEIASTRDATGALSELRIDTETWRVQFSNDDGMTYADDYALVTIPATQGALMGLKPGVNNMQYVNTGTPNAVLEYYFFAKYAT